MIIAKGKEPERVKVRMQALFEKLRGAYPDMVVSGLDKDHKHWAETALELSRVLGYPSKNEFLEAYGFRVIRKEPSAPTGRPTSVDSASVIKTLQTRYPNGSGFSKLDDLFAANPDLLPFKKTLSNKASASFGMPLGQYLKQIGILNSSAESLEDKIRILQERYRDCALPDTVAQLKSDNADLKISGLDSLIRKEAKEEPIPYLYRLGLLSESCYNKYAENEDPKGVVDQFISSLCEKIPEGTTFASFSKLQQEFPELDWQRYQVLSKRAYDKSLDYLLKELGLVSSGWTPRLDERNILTESQRKRLYCDSKGDLRPGIIENSAKKLEQYLRENGYSTNSREELITNASNGAVSHYNLQYYISEDGKRITIAHRMYTNSCKEEHFLNKYPVGKEIQIIRDTYDDSLDDRFSGLRAITRQSNKLYHYCGGLRSLTTLFDLGKVHFENGRIEYNKDKSVIASYDACFSEQLFNPAAFRTPAMEELFSLVSYELPDMPPQKYEQQYNFHNRSEVCFSNGVARGPESDLRKLMDVYHHYNTKLTKTKIPNIFELSLKDFFDYYPGSAYLNDVIKKFPTLKIAGFIEDWSCGEVHVAYSESGYGFVTDTRFAGTFDTKADWSWHWEHGPTDTIKDRSPDIRTGIMHNVSYSFPFKKQWDSNNYVVEKDGKTYLLKAKAGKPQKVDLPFDSKELWKLNTQGMAFVNEAYIAEYLGDEVHVRFPEKVGDKTIIGICQRSAQTPSRYKKIESVQLPDSYVRIGANAFKGCEALREVVLPSRLAEMGSDAFADCTALESVTFSGDLSRETYEFNKNCSRSKEKQPIAEGVFRNCTSLKKVWLTGSKTELSQVKSFPRCEQYVIYAPQVATYVKEHNPGHVQLMEWEDAADLLKKTTGEDAVELYMESENTFDKLPAPGDVFLLNHPNSMAGKGLTIFAWNHGPCDFPDLLRGFSLKLEVIRVMPQYSSWFVVMVPSPAEDDARESCVIPKMKFCGLHDSPIKGKIFALDNQTCAIQLEKLIKERGGIVKSSVTLDTDYLIINPDLKESTAKRRRADEIRAKGKSNVKNITYQEFYDMICVPGSKVLSPTEKAAREAAEKAEVERKAREAAEKAEAERKAREAAEKAEAERKAREAAEKAEAERKAREAAEKAEAERKAREAAEIEEAKRKALAAELKAVAERKAREEAARAEAERKAREAAEKAEAERKAREAAEKAEAERRAAEEARKKKAEEEQRAYEKAVGVWKQETQKTEAARKNELARRRKAHKDELTKQYSKVYANAKNAAQQALAAAQKKKAQAEETLASLGMFKFSEKKTQKALIEEAEAEIGKAEQALVDAEKANTAALAVMEELLDQYVETQVKDVERRFPLPIEPKKPTTNS